MPGRSGVLSPGEPFHRPPWRRSRGRWPAGGSVRAAARARFTAARGAGSATSADTPNAVEPGSLIAPYCASPSSLAGRVGKVTAWIGEASRYGSGIQRLCRPAPRFRAACDRWLSHRKPAGPGAEARSVPAPLTCDPAIFRLKRSVIRPCSIVSRQPSQPSRHSWLPVSSVFAVSLSPRPWGAAPSCRLHAGTCGRGRQGASMFITSTA
jgi:hypothetical protein